MIWLRIIRASALLLGVGVSAACITGCSKSTQPKAERLSDTEPNANVRITSQTLLGLQGEYTSVYSLRRADDGSFAFHGVYKSPVGVGVLNADGSLRWFQQTTYNPREVGTLPGTALVPHGVVVAGRLDTDGDGEPDVGYAALYSSAGSLLSQIPLASDSSALRLNGFTVVDDSTIIASGGERRSGVDYPLLVLLRLNVPAAMVIARTVSLASPNGRLGGIVTLPSPGADLILAATSVNGASLSIHGLRAPRPALDPITVEWSHEIPSTNGPWAVTALGLVEAGGNLYVAGTVNDNHRPAASGVWNSGLAASYTGSGDLRWLSIVSATQHSDGFNDVTVGPDAVFAVGKAAAYSTGGDPSEDESFGYGWISKLDLDTGHVLANFTLGDDHCQSGFNSAAWSAGGLSCAGFTLQEHIQGHYRGWFAAVNVSDTVSIAAMPTAAGRIGAARHEAVARPTRWLDRGP